MPITEIEIGGLNVADYSYDQWEIFIVANRNHFWAYASFFFFCTQKQNTK